MKKRINNKGMTLVELLISVSILAILVLPLLSAFVQSSRTNARAKTKLSASELAYNIMEGLENVTLEKVAYQFNYSAEGFDLFSTAGGEKICELEDVKGKLVPVTKTEDVRAEVSNKEDLITSSIIKQTDGTYKFAGQDSHKYYFYVKDITVDKKKFNALITVDAKTKESGTVNEKVNNTPVASMESVDTTFDAISANTDTAHDVITDIQNIYNLTNLKEEDISRTITVDVSKKTKTNVTQVKVSFRYSFYDTKRGRKVIFPEPGTIYENDYTSVVYDNSSHKNDSLRSIFLLYYPWYSSKDVFPINKDSIVINNPDYIPCTMHIIKQNVVDSNLLYKYEKDYRTAVFLNEENNKGKAVMKIESNLGYNMKDSSVVSNQVTYVYNNSFANQSNIKDYISIRKLNEQDASDRLFDVKIDIYPEGTDISNVSTDDLIVSITGGMTD